MPFDFDTSSRYLGHPPSRTHSGTSWFRLSGRKPSKLMKNSASAKRWKLGFLAGVPFNQTSFHPELLPRCPRRPFVWRTSCHRKVPGVHFAVTPLRPHQRKRPVHIRYSFSPFYALTKIVSLYMMVFRVLYHCISPLFYTRTKP